MNRLIILLGFLFFTIPMFAQQSESYLPMQVGNSWEITAYEMWLPPSSTNSYTVSWKIIGDTICNDKKYFIFITNQQKRYFREIENSDVVEYFPSCSKEYLLYPFSLCKSDTDIFVHGSFYGPNSNCDTIRKGFLYADYSVKYRTLHCNHSFYETYFEKSMGLTGWHTDFYNVGSVRIILNGICVTCNPQVQVKQIIDIPDKYKLRQNYPNPFNPSTKISFSIPQKGFAIIKIFDVQGRELETILNEYKEAGVWEVTFDASKLSSGVYFYKLSVGDYTETKKMNLIR